MIKSFFAKVPWAAGLALLPAFLGDCNSRAAIPPAEKLLPDDTLIMVSAPDFGKVREIWKKSPQIQLLNDPAMKPFVDKFTAKWNEKLLRPLERELGIHWEDYSSLPQGQVTFAVTQNKAPAGQDQAPGVLLLLDARDKSGQLKKNIADFRKKWTESGKPVRTEKIRGTDFIVLAVSAGDAPQTWKKYFGNPADAQRAPDGAGPKPAAERNDIVLGQFESLLIAGNSIKAVEKIMVHLTGGAAPALDDQAAYHANHLALFRDAPLYGWINAKLLVDLLNPAPAAKAGADTPPPAAAVQTDKIIASTGLSGLNTIAFSYTVSNDGSMAQVFFGVPDSGRQGIFKIAAGEPKDSGPPPFVPADAVAFSRWRIDGQKAWATLEKMMNDTSPSYMSAVNLIIDTVNENEKIKDPVFDLRKYLIGNLGDDFIRYEKAPRGTTAAELSSPPSLFLIGSAHPEELASSLRGIFLILPQGGAPPTERDFLGHKIYSVTVPSTIFGLPEPGVPRTRTLSYSTSGGYVALSTDAPMLEEYLRGSADPPKPLRETPGLTEAMSKVSGLGTAIFGYENQSQTMRSTFQSWKNSSGPPVFLPLPDGRNPDTAPAAETFKDWVDFSLLPDFSAVSKYFYFTVYGGSANVDGLLFKTFWPVPPQTKK